jgi:hypothetical protein
MRRRWCATSISNTPKAACGAPVTARFGADGITIIDPNRAGEGAEKVFARIYEKAI